MSPAPTQVTITGLQPGDTVRLRAVTAAGPGAASAPVTVVGPPGAPSITAASWSAGAGTFTVAAPTSDGGSPVTGYQSSVGGGTWATVGAGPGTFAVTVPLGGTVRFRALNAHGAGTATAPATVATASVTRSYGDPTSFVVPAGVSTLTVEMYGGVGGGGGWGYLYGSPTGDTLAGGSSAKQPVKVTGTLAVTPGETLELAAGQAGEWGHYREPDGTTTTLSGGTGGLNPIGAYRGGDGGASIPTATRVAGSGGGGGAASVLRRGTTVLAVASGGPGGGGAWLGSGVDRTHDATRSVQATTNGGNGHIGEGPTINYPAGGGGGAGGVLGGSGGSNRSGGSSAARAGFWGDSSASGLTGATIADATTRSTTRLPLAQRTLTGYRNEDGSVTVSWVGITLT